LKLTRAEYCQFTLSGRIELLRLYGKFICAKIIKTKKIIIFKLYDFYVAVIKDLLRNRVIEADPVWSNELLQFFISL
jgi:hypothetical protein